MTDRHAAPQGARVDDGSAAARPIDGAAEGEQCDYCGATTLTWRKCKLICTSCSMMNKSCADL